ncbi:SGNH/GDSL hydrolase family protein [Rhodococcoides fascians]|uniref:SGNH/GDSL hydrolase family protein n=1 Tax=Rhodococcoides fascians TaxID=1828 RepID=UPI00050CF549|nr:GDSL-type esterase/lipase family protein [Rhodococcus fascians]
MGILDAPSLAPSIAAEKYTRRPSTAVLLGDSITYANGPIVENLSVQYGQNGWWTWAMRELGHPLRLLANVSTIGHTSTQILARFDGEVAPLKPGYVVILAGRNDGAAGAAATIANLQAMYDKAFALGSIVIALTIPPCNTLEAGQRTADNTINQWIKRQGRSRRNFIAVDVASVLQDISGNMNTPLVSSDGKHPNSLGARRMGKLVASVLGPILPRADILPTNNDDAANLLANPLMFSTFGSVDSGATGTVASSWRVGLTGSGGTVVASKVASTDKYPNLDWQQLVVSATGSGGGQLYQYASAAKVAAAVAAGGELVAAMEFEIDAGASAPTIPGGYGSGVNLRLAFMNDSFTILGQAHDMFYNEVYPLEQQERFGVMRTPPRAIPAGTTKIQLAAQVNMIGTARFRRGDTRKLLTPAEIG